MGVLARRTCGLICLGTYLSNVVCLAVLKVLRGKWARMAVPWEDRRLGWCCANRIVAVNCEIASVVSGRRSLAINRTSDEPCLAQVMAVPELITLIIEMVRKHPVCIWCSNRPVVSNLYCSRCEGVAFPVSPPVSLSVVASFVDDWSSIEFEPDHPS